MIKIIVQKAGHGSLFVAKKMTMVFLILILNTISHNFVWMCEWVKVARMASERIKEECRIQSGGKKQSQKKERHTMPGNRHTKKASTEALAFWVVGYHPTQWTKLYTLTELARTKHHGWKFRQRRCRTQDTAGKRHRDVRPIVIKEKEIKGRIGHFAGCDRSASPIL